MIPHGILWLPITNHVSFIDTLPLIPLSNLEHPWLIFNYIEEPLINSNHTWLSWHDDPPFTSLTSCDLIWLLLIKLDLTQSPFTKPSPVVHTVQFKPRKPRKRGVWGAVLEVHEVHEGWGEGWSHNYSHKHTHTKPLRVNFVFGPISAHGARTWK